jgi:F-type H+-transporting ATPase subunit gamma
MGAQLRVYRQKIKSAQTTKKITRAMELISASRIQKAQARVAASTPYSRAITRAVSAVSSYSNVEHILTTEPEKVERAAIVIFSSDRGLAGAFNSNVLKESEQLAELLRSQGKDVVYFLVGRKASAYFAFRRRASEKTWQGGTDNPEFDTAKEIGDAILESFLKPAAEGGVDEIHIVYNRFVSMLVQVPEVVRLLPLEVVEGVEEPDSKAVLPLYEFEPDAGFVLDSLLPVYIESRLFNAMKAASDNADGLIRDYTRLANNARQSEITQQISEIVGGADALSSAK